MLPAFDADAVSSMKQRIGQLTPESQPQWGTMSVGQMLAHCNVTYALVYEPPSKKPGFITSLLLKLFVKKSVVSDKPYKQNLQTAPYFIVSDDKDFVSERDRLLAYIDKTANLGSEYFDNRESHSFGPLTASEWSTMFTKHLEHHLSQFKV